MLRKSALIAIPLVVLSLTACVGGGENGTGGAGGAEGKTPDSTGSVVDITDTPGSLEEFVGAVEDAKPTRCEATTTGWVSEGEVTNSSDSDQNYRLYVSFMNRKDTRGLVQVDLESVPPGESSTWTAEAEIAGDAIDCVLRVERYPAGE